MNPQHQIPTNGRSGRANKAVTQAMGGRDGKPFYGEGMHLGNSTPPAGETNTKPIQGGLPPTSKQQTVPGNGATPIRKAGKV